MKARISGASENFGVVTNGFLDLENPKNTPGIQYRPSEHMKKSVIVKISEIQYSSHFGMLGKVILVYNTQYILYDSVYKRLG